MDDEGEGIRKKGPDKDWLRRRAERGSYAGIITELAAEDLIVARKHFLMSERHWKLINIVLPWLNWETYVADVKVVFREAYVFDLRRKQFLFSSSKICPKTSTCAREARCQ